MNDEKHSGVWTPLIGASSGGQFKIVKLLLDKSADPNLFTHKGTALFEACEKGNLQMVQLLLERGADKSILGRKYPHLTTRIIYSPREIAGQEGHTEIVQLLDAWPDTSLPD